MKMLRPIATVGLLLLGAAMSVSAQTSAVTPTAIQRNNEGRILQPDISTAPTVNSTTKPRPDRLERTLPPEIKDQVKKFERAREAFIQRQEELRKQMDGATTEKERDSVRQRIKEGLDRWREQARQFRDEARERVKELQRELPNLREALQETPGGGNVKPGGRPRPGID